MEKPTTMSMHSQIQDRILGALWGSVLGDVIGAHLEFDNDITPKKIEQSFAIVGGGKHKLEPGQPTDDSELNYAVCRALFRSQTSKNTSVLNLNHIAESMADWFTSCPIDVGGTIRNSVPKACNMKVHQAHLLRKGSREKSQKSQSNGTLMALIGLSTWCWRLQSDKDVLGVVIEFTKLIHPNQTVWLVNCMYALMVRGLLARINEQEAQHKEQKVFQRGLRVYEKAKIILKENKGLFKEENYHEFQKWVEVIDAALAAEEQGDVKIDHKVNQNTHFKSNRGLQILQKQVPINKASGWVRIAFSYSCFFTAIKHQRKSSYSKMPESTAEEIPEQPQFYSTIKYIISQKGDTDTNACIVGGMIGAKLGLQALKREKGIEKAIEKIKTWRPKSKKRPEWMVPGLCLEKYAQFFYKSAPETLQSIIGSEAEYQNAKKK